MVSPMRRSATALVFVVSAFLSGFDWPGSGEDLARQYPSATADERTEILSRAASLANTDPAAATVLLTALRESPVDTRALCARLVGRHRVLSARETVFTLLDDPSELIRSAATEALGALGGDNTLSALRRVLGDSSPAVRLAAISAVTRVGGRDAALSLVDRVHDTERDVRLAALRSLGELGDSRAVLSVLGALQDPVAEVRVEATVALGRLRDPRAVRGLVGLLHDPQTDVRIASLRALGALGPSGADAVDHIIAAHAALDVQNPGQRAVLRLAAVDALSTLGTDRACEALTRIFLEGDLVETRRASVALTACTATVIRRLPSLIADVHGRTETPLIELLGSLGGDTAANALLALLPSNRLSPSARSLVLRALGHTGSDSALVPLLRAAAGEPVTAQEQTTLRSRGAQCGLGDSMHAIEGLRAWARRRGALDPAAIDPLRAILDDTDPGCWRVVVPLIELLGATENPRAAVTLTSLLEHNNLSVRLTAADSLRNVPSSDHGLALIRSLSDPSPQVRAAAADSLSLQGDNDTLTALSARWSTPEALDRASAARALARIALRLSRTTPTHSLATVTSLLVASRSRAAPALSASLIDSLGDLAAAGSTTALDALVSLSYSTRLSDRVATLASLGTALFAHGSLSTQARARAVDALTTALDAPPYTESSRRALHSTALWSLGAAGETVVPRLTHALGDVPEISANAAGALALIARNGVTLETTTVRALCAALSQRSIALRVNSALALATAPPNACDDSLTAAFEDRSALVRSAVARAMGHRARRSTDPQEASRWRLLLAHCAATDPSPEVAALCAQEQTTAVTVTERESYVDVRVVDPDGTPRRAQSVWLTLPDGRLRTAVTDPDGWLHEHHQPVGRFGVITPESIPRR